MILQGDCLERLKELPDNSVHCCVTSPPYWGLRDYGIDGQLGLEKTPEEYVEKMVEVFREVRRVLRDDGTLWLNLGDSYAGNMNKSNYNTGFNERWGNAPGQKKQEKAVQNIKRTVPDGLKPKDLVGIPWRVAFALQDDGWYLRSDIIWHKPNAMPESVKDRPTKAHEYIFLFSKSPNYYYDADAIREPFTQDKPPGNKRPYDSGRPDGMKMRGNRTIGNPKGRNKRTVWNVNTKPFKDAHFAVYPPELIEPCILAGCPEGGTVLDPFFGSGTTGLVALQNNRQYIGIELNPEYIKIAQERLKQAQPKEKKEIVIGGKTFVQMALEFGT